VRVDESTDQRFTFFADPDGLPLELDERRRASTRTNGCDGRVAILKVVLK
jgi:hypothetical protein